MFMMKGEQFAALVLVEGLEGEITTARIIAISLKYRNRPNGVLAAVFLARPLFSRTIYGLRAHKAVLISPNTNGRPRFDLEFFQDVLHVFLHGARAAPENLSDLAIAFAGG